MCFWLHSDLKGYRDWVGSWAALAEGEWNLTSGEQSHHASQGKDPAALLLAQERPSEGHWRTCPWKGCQAGRWARVSSSCNPTQAPLQHILSVPDEQLQTNSHPSSLAGVCGLSFLMADAGATGGMYQATPWDGTGSLIYLLRSMSWIWLGSWCHPRGLLRKGRGEQDHHLTVSSKNRRVWHWFHQHFDKV